MVKALSIHPDCLLCDELLVDMKSRWFTLTANGWHDVIAIYVRSGLIEQALEGLEDMRKKGITIQSWLYDLVLFMLCELQEVDEALALMKYRIRAGDDKSSGGVWFHLFDTACAVLHVCFCVYDDRI